MHDYICLKSYIIVCISKDKYKEISAMTTRYIATDHHRNPSTTTKHTEAHRMTCLQLMKLPNIDMCDQAVYWLPLSLLFIL